MFHLDLWFSSRAPQAQVNFDLESHQSRSSSLHNDLLSMPYLDLALAAAPLAYHDRASLSRLD